MLDARSRIETAHRPAYPRPLLRCAWRTLSVSLLVAAISPAIHAQDVEPYAELARTGEFGADAFLVLPADLLVMDDALFVLDEAEARIFKVRRDGFSLDAVTGRAGDGPGEFRLPGPLAPGPEGGSVLTWDRLAARLSTFGPDLVFRSDTRLPLNFREDGFIDEMRALAGDSLLAAATTWPMAGYHDQSRIRVIVTTAGGATRVVYEAPGTDVVANLTDPGFTTVVRQPFGARAVIRFSGDGADFWTGRTDGGRFERRSSVDGSLLDVIELDLRGPEVGRADRTAWFRDQEAQFASAVERSGLPEQSARERMEWIRTSVEFPARKPAWEDFVFGPGGDLWIRLAGTGGHAREWLRVHPADGVSRHLTVPHRGEAFLARVAGDTLYVTERNELDVWELVAYAPARRRADE